MDNLTDTAIAAVKERRDQVRGSNQANMEVPQPELAGAAMTSTTGNKGEGTSNRRVLQAAIAILRQGEEMLTALTGDVYTRRIPAVFQGSIGGHYRHCLDHFSSLLRGVSEGWVDYDNRERDQKLETLPEMANSLTRNLRKAIEGLRPEQLEAPVIARCEVSYEKGDSPPTTSTLGRELVYVIAHAIHHYALISVMARLMDAKLPEHFGVAPSTVVHLRTMQQTASTHG
jgi:uncharacterized damage-inducible protein DinB